MKPKEINLQHSSGDTREFVAEWLGWHVDALQPRYNRQISVSEAICLVEAALSRQGRPEGVGATATRAKEILERVAISNVVGKCGFNNWKEARDGLRDIIDRLATLGSQVRPAPSPDLSELLRRVEHEKRVLNELGEKCAPLWLNTAGRIVGTIDDLVKALASRSAPDGWVLRKALEPFAREADLYADSVPDALVPTIHCLETDTESAAVYSVGDLRRARALTGPATDRWVLVRREVLEPFAQVEHHRDEPDHWPAYGRSAGQGWPTVGDFRAVAQAIAASPSALDGEGVVERPSWMTSRQILHVEAREIASRLIASHFRNTDQQQARISIPANPDRDDDLLLLAYIHQQEALSTPSSTLTPDEREELERLRAWADGPDGVKWHTARTLKLQEELDALKFAAPAIREGRE